MKKKQKKVGLKSEKLQSIDWFPDEVRGFVTFSFAFVLLLSLFSFAISPDSKNLLGLAGYTIGWLFHALFGLGSYLLALYIGWIGWRKLFRKPLHHLVLKGTYFAVALCSFCILSSLVECYAASLGGMPEKFFYPGLYAKKQHFHLGGAPFYYLYCGLPSYNMHRLFNTLGVGLVFSITFVSGLLFLFKIDLSALLQRAVARLRREHLAASRKESSSLPEENGTKGAKEDKPFSSGDSKEGASDFLRYVKLRIPTNDISEGLPKSATPLQPNSDLLAIHPDRNPLVRPSLSRKEQKDDESEAVPKNDRKESSDQMLLEEPFLLPGKKEPVTSKEIRETVKRKREEALAAQSVYNGDFTEYVLPGVNLLSNAKKVDQSTIKKDLKRQAEVLEETLSSFGIEAKVGQINCGPTITSFEVHPAIGVKVQKIKTLDNDIALNMEAKSIRIIAPIPGKAAVGIEVPNSQPQEVGFKDMLTAYQQSSHKFNIPILLGKAVNGDYVMSDLSKMPHCIIAGATGSGKSVCINTIVMSIVMNAKPDRIKLVMVDPKKVELTPYSKLPHMLAPVITEPQGAAAALNWLVKEMERRYEILKLVGVRNIDSFNKRTIDKDAEAALNQEIPEFMPYIVGIIDELADLMMVAAGDIETPVARIAQMARAVGIHLILATQRPSREVITGLIKANFPTRISFKVASRVNSQIVLDETGAESLLGNGDMLFLPPGSSHVVRAQGAFIRDEDIQAVVGHICRQAPPNYIIQSFDQMNFETAGGTKNHEGEQDSLYQQAEELVLRTGNASTTFLQRNFKIGYARAANLMDRLAERGIVGPADGSKPRKIYGKRQEDQDELAFEDAY